MFHSEYGQDRFVDNLLQRSHGTFVEFGALDGILHSNSLYFEREKNWTGLLIEPNPTAFQTLILNRPHCKVANAAVYDHEGVVEFEAIEGGLYGWSGIRESIEPQHWSRIRDRGLDRSVIEVRCRPLDSILSDLGISEIDYLSIDVEGAELKILSVFPFSKYTIDVLGVEDNFGNPVLDELIRGNGFRFLGRCGPDLMYRRI